MKKHSPNRAVHSHIHRKGHACMGLISVSGHVSLPCIPSLSLTHTHTHAEKTRGRRPLTHLFRHEVALLYMLRGYVMQRKWESAMMIKKPKGEQHVEIAHCPV